MTQSIPEKEESLQQDCKRLKRSYRVGFISAPVSNRKVRNAVSVFSALISSAASILTVVNVTSISAPDSVSSFSPTSRVNTATAISENDFEVSNQAEHASGSPIKRSRHCQWIDDAISQLIACGTAQKTFFQCNLFIRMHC